MFPILFEVPGLGWPVTSFGVLVAAGFLASWRIIAWRFDELGVDQAQADAVLLYCIIGGLLGSKLYYAVDTWLLADDAPFLPGLLSRGGITWYGGLIGGALLAGFAMHRRGVPFLLASDAVALAAPFGQALGRVGCFLVGDDWGRRTDLPWGVAFPQGLDPVEWPVHPTQLYEVVWLLPVGLWLLRRRHGSAFLFGEYLILAAAGRFVIEFFRVNTPVALGLTEAQWIALLLSALGAGGLIWRGRAARTASG